MYVRQLRGFTIVEVLFVIVVIAVLATITAVSYGTWQQRVADKSVQSDLLQAIAALKTYKNFENSYPPNLAGTDFASSTNVGLTLYTNAPALGIYNSLNNDQNAQLFLNVCNANVAGTNSTSCSFAGTGNGSKIHVKGTNSTNAIWDMPIQQSDITLSCGAACVNATSTMISQFSAQGGTFPIQGSGNTTALPQPTQSPNGPATKYCLEGRSSQYPYIVYYTLSSSMSVQSGSCPGDPELHYYP